VVVVVFGTTSRRPRSTALARVGVEDGRDEAVPQAVHAAVIVAACRAASAAPRRRARSRSPYRLIETRPTAADLVLRRSTSAHRSRVDRGTRRHAARVCPIVGSSTAGTSGAKFHRPHRDRNRRRSPSQAVVMRRSSSQDRGVPARDARGAKPSRSARQLARRRHGGADRASSRASTLAFAGCLGGD